MNRKKPVTPEQTARLALLREQVKDFPTLPGVYIMKDEAADTIYIGKAKNRRARVRSYFAGGDGRLQIEFLLRRIWTIEKIVTASEEQAFILERDLINKHKPRYNIRLKDDKSYLSIRLDENARWPRVQLTRRVANDGALYYGPYTFSYEVRGLLELINKTLPLRTCTDTVLYNRQRPCLEYQIKRCAAPCCLPIDPEVYAEWVQQAKKILEGKVDTLIPQLTEKMEQASDQLEFERAADYRDKIEMLKSFSKAQDFISPGGEDRDVFALYREEQFVALSVLNVRRGRVSDNRNFALQDVQVSDAELLADSVEQYYRKGREVPEEILLPTQIEDADLLKKVLAERRGRTVQLFTPQRGLKFRLLKLAEVNAQQHFSTTFDAESRYLQMAESLATMMGLTQVPRRIECVDISNFQGSEIVGAVVSFFDGKPDKRNYKKYILKNQGKPDDFASMNEVLERRLRRGKKELSLPDLIIIDGGKGQLRAAIAARDALEVRVDIISLAKERVDTSKQTARVTVKPERLFSPDSSEAHVLSADSEVHKFVSRIRDEVHRFVITFHRQRRQRAGMKSVLDDISGLGPERKRRLFKEYGSIAKMRAAPVEELAKAGRMPASLAKKVLSVLHSTRSRSSS